MLSRRINNRYLGLKYFQSIAKSELSHDSKSIARRVLGHNVIVR